MKGLVEKKNDESYPREAIDYLLQEFGVKPKDIECVVFVSTHWSPAWILSGTIHLSQQKIT